MKATQETRRRMLLAVTGLLTPVALWVALGLYDRLASRRPSSSFQQELLSREELLKYEKLRGHMLDAASRGDWSTAAQMAQDTCGRNCPPRIFPLQAEAHWRLGNRQQSADLWSRALPWESPVAQADFQALKGDKTTYLSFVAPLLVSQERVPLNDAAWACVVMADALPDYGPVVALAEKALRQTASPEDRGNVLNTLGVALYRAGRYKEAIQRLDESERLTKTKMNTIFLALSYHKLGQREKAQRLAEEVYSYLRASLAEFNRFRPEFLVFEKELSAALPPKKATAATKATTP